MRRFSDILIWNLVNKTMTIGSTHYKYITNEIHITNIIYISHC